MSLEFLEVLESRVREAAERLEELAAENASLKKEIEKLEREKSAKPDKAAEKLEKAWAKEREEIRHRLETLIERLTGLLGDH